MSWIIHSGFINGLTYIGGQTAGRIAVGVMVLILGSFWIMLCLAEFYALTKVFYNHMNIYLQIKPLVRTESSSILVQLTSLFHFRANKSIDEYY